MDGNRSILEKKIKMGYIKFQEECELVFEMFWKRMCIAFQL
jgi:hypothetical protein